MVLILGLIKWQILDVFSLQYACAIIQINVQCRDTKHAWKRVQMRVYVLVHSQVSIIICVRVWDSPWACVKQQALFQAPLVSVLSLTVDQLPSTPFACHLPLGQLGLQQTLLTHTHTPSPCGCPDQVQRHPPHQLPALIFYQQNCQVQK